MFPWPMNANGKRVLAEYTPAAGDLEWVDYIPVQVVTATTENRHDDDGYLATVSITPTTEQAWVDYVPVVTVIGRADRWRVEPDGFIPVDVGGAAVVTGLGSATAVGTSNAGGDGNVALVTKIDGAGTRWVKADDSGVDFWADEDLSTAWNWPSSSGTWGAGTAASLTINTLNGLAITNDGLTYYATDAGGDDIHYGTLSSAYTASAFNAPTDILDISGETLTVKGCCLGHGVGERYLYTVDGSTIWRYDLGSPGGLVSTATQDQSATFATGATDARDVAFSSSGLSVFVVDTTAANVYQYDLTVPWDLTTLNTTSVDSLATGLTSPRSIWFGPNTSGTPNKGLYVQALAGLNSMKQWNLA